MFGNNSAFQPALLLFDQTTALGGMNGVERDMEVASTSVDPSLHLGMTFYQRNGQEAQSTVPILKRFPVQLDLLPLHPASTVQSTASPTPPSSLTQTSHHSVPGVSRDQDGATIVAVHSCSHNASPRGIDMNQLPSSDYDDADVSSPNSILSPFNYMEPVAIKPDAANAMCNKRDRERFTDFDQEAADRGFEATSLASDEEDGSMPRKKLRLSKEQSALLEESFKEHSTLNPKQKSALAKQLNLRPRQVEVWFQNRRARTKLKQTEVDCELLRRCCDSLTEENRRLQKELQELRAIKLPPPFIITPDFFMPFPAATLSMCPSCERVTPLDMARSTLLHSLPQPAITSAVAPASFPNFPKSVAAAFTH